MGPKGFGCIFDRASSKLTGVTRRNLLFGSMALAVSRERLDDARRLIEAKIASGEVVAAVLLVRSGKSNFARAFGKARNADAVFLLASITKPMTATAVMLLADRGELSLSDPAQKFVPELKGGERGSITIRHLLTHTSGLPDMLPENEELRKRHAPLSEFVAATCSTPLLFSPGTQVRYQSMGILLAAEIVHRITHQPFPEFLRAQVYRPLGMNSTSLGMGGRAIADTMPSQVDEVTNWDWNSPYWRNLAAPWGGAHAPAGDVARLLAYFARPESGPLKPQTAAAMIRDQNTGLNQPWGIGWALEAARFGQTCQPGTFGHSGSTGTLCWFDPKRDLSFVLLTTKPAVHSGKTLIKPVADLVSQAV